MRGSTPVIRQRGMVLIMMVLMLALLLAFAALALDLGRLYVLRTEMQNAVDAAALAAAAELNAKGDAMERARAAAKGLFEEGGDSAYQSHFAKTKALLGTDLIEEDDIAFDFFCSIGTADEQLIDISEFCPGDEVEADKRGLQPEDADEQAHYVRVTLNPNLAGDTERYGIDLYFLPLLRVMGIPTDDFIDLKATALAGRHFYYCRYPPVMLCDPFEHLGGFRSNVDPGDQILLRQQGGPGASWAPGSFGFLDPDLTSGGGANETADSLASAGGMPCTDPRVMTSTGQQVNKTSAAVNTRFDIYHPDPDPTVLTHPRYNESSSDDYPPAPNVLNYEKDSNLDPARPEYDETARVGNGSYVDENGKTRWEQYRDDIDAGLGQPSHAPGDLERRVWSLAVLSCDSLGVSGSGTYPILEQAGDGFAKVFLTESVKADQPDKADIYVEYIGWESDKDENYHVVIQLYE